MSSGGVGYHLRALRFQNTLWGPYQERVRKFLDTWNPNDREELLLFGPSGGYSLPVSFIQSFKKVIAVEPDPLARIIFEKRFGIKPKWIKRKIRFDQEKDLKLFSDFNGPILFCNLLGQIPIKKVGPTKKVLLHFLKDKNWATFHDAMSGVDVEFDCEDAPPSKASFSEMKSWIYVGFTRSDSVQVNAHLAPDFFDPEPGCHFSYWMWKITPRQSHLIEGVFKRV